MKDTKFRILLDIHEVRSQATIPVKVGDVSCKIYITLVEGGKPYKIHENSFGVFTGKKGDDNYLFNNCVIENGIIRYDFTPQTVAAAGVLECEIRIYDEDGGVLTTPSFNIVVDERAVNDSELASAPEFAFLDEILVNEGQRIENERNRNEAFNNLGIDLEDDGEVISIVKTDIDGSQEKSTFLKYADVIPSVTATATGSAITIESSQAPLQNLKLYGKTEQNGTPTPTEPKELKSVGDSGSFEVGLYGKNILNSLSLWGSGSSQRGVSYTRNADGSYTLSGIVTDEGSIGEVEVRNFPIGVALTLSGGIGGFIYNSEGIHKGVWLDNDVISLEKGDFVRLILTYATKGSVLNATVYPQIEIGTQATPYEPCNKQTLTMPYTLRSVGDIKDEVDFNRGMFIQRVTTVTLNGTTGFSYDSGNNRFYVYGNTGVRNGGYVKKSTHYVNGETGSGGMNFTFNIDNYAIYIKDTRFTNATDFNNWLSSNNVTIIAPIGTQREIPLTETELNDYKKLHTNKPTTTILSEADMEVDYYVNKPNAQAIGNIHSQVNEDYFKLQQAIISTGGSTL